MKRTVVLVFTLALVFGSAEATQVIRSTPRQIADVSELAVQGKVSRVQSYWNADHTRIMTEARIAVDETFKGNAGSVVRVVQIGGTVGNVQMTTHGAVAWKNGQEVVLFLERAGSDTYQVAGLSLGKFDVRRDGRTGQAQIERPADGGARQLSADGATSTPNRTEVVSVDQFIREALGRR